MVVVGLANGISIALDVKGNGSGNRHSPCKRFASPFFLTAMRRHEHERQICNARD